ncbi:hypothetical protein BGX33_002711, partial [Mortierella sp. NVP41]
MAPRCLRWSATILLSLANLEQKVKDKLDEVCDKDKDPRWMWEQCEQTFVECALSAFERQTEVEDFTRQGQREVGE